MCGGYERRTGKSERAGAECTVIIFIHLPYFCKMKFVQNVIVFFALILCIGGCTQLDVYEKNATMPKQEWAYSFKPSFDFTITDTNSSYGIYIVLRHTDAYRYNNIWLNAGTKFPGDSMRYQRLELSLGNDATGWEGTGMDDIWEVRKPITKGPIKLSKTGNYTFTLSQVMRENPLEHIMSAGIRVEKVK
jgi:gliding motility-associated lipoprotein GldH